MNRPFCTFRTSRTRIPDDGAAQSGTNARSQVTRVRGEPRRRTWRASGATGSLAALGMTETTVILNGARAAGGVKDPVAPEALSRRSSGATGSLVAAHERR